MSLPFEYRELPKDYDPQRLGAVLRDLLQAIVAGYQYVQLQSQSASPAKAFAGMLVIADGTNWNPGSGGGLYRRSSDNTTWTKLADLSELTALYQPLDATLTALAGNNWAANALPIGSGADTMAQVSFAANTFPARSSAGNLVAKTITDYALTVLDDADAPTARVTLGLPDLGLSTTAAASGMIADLDDATVLSGIYYANAAATGTNPISAGTTGVVVHRVAGTQGAQIFISAATGRIFWRGRAASAWLAWQEAPALGAANTFTASNTFSSTLVAAAIGPTSARQHTLPNVASDTVALVGQNNNFSAAQTFAQQATFTLGLTTPSNINLTGAASTLGYATGSGGAVTQATSKSTGVTLNKSCGAITMNAAALAAATSVAFTLTNSQIAATDTVVVNIKSGAASTLSYMVCVVTVAAGSCVIQVRNNSAGSLSEALVLNYSVIKAAAS